MRKAKLRVFIGSSRESLPVVRAIERGIEGNRSIEITAWDKMMKRSGIGLTLIETLIKASSSYDAAVIVFGTDDLRVSRGVRQQVPRDNVIFELGLFMGNLDKTRTVVVAPDERSNLTVPSDIHDLNLLTYSSRGLRKSMNARQKSEIHDLALHDACKALATHLANLPPKETVHESISFGVVRRDLSDARTVRSIRNIALDMEQTWPMLRDDILENDSITNVSVETLMIDGYSPEIRRMSSATVSVRTAREQERHIVDYCTSHAKQLMARRIRFTCSAYSEIPVLHGFLVNGRKLMISVCSVDKGKLIGSPNPYLPFVTLHHGSRDKTAAYLFGAFNAWFDYRQKHARLVWRNA